MKAAKKRGFTLIELVITMAIIAVLASIAVPSYQDSVRKSRRKDAEAALMNLQIQQEKWRANNPAYTTFITDLRTTVPSNVLAYYQVTIPNVSVSATTYTIQAAAIAGKSQVKDVGGGVSCATLTVDQSGTRAPAGCW